MKLENSEIIKILLDDSDVKAKLGNIEKLIANMGKGSGASGGILGGVLVGGNLGAGLGMAHTAIRSFGRAMTSQARVFSSFSGATRETFAGISEIGKIASENLKNKKLSAPFLEMNKSVAIVGNAINSLEKSTGALGKTFGGIFKPLGMGISQFNNGILSGIIGTVVGASLTSVLAGGIAKLGQMGRGDGAEKRMAKMSESLQSMQMAVMSMLIFGKGTAEISGDVLRAFITQKPGEKTSDYEARLAEAAKSTGSTIGGMVGGVRDLGTGFFKAVKDSFSGGFLTSEIGKRFKELTNFQSTAGMKPYEQIGYGTFKLLEGILKAVLEIAILIKKGANALGPNAGIIERGVFGMDSYFQALKKTYMAAGKSEAEATNMALSETNTVLTKSYETLSKVFELIINTAKILGKIVVPGLSGLSATENTAKKTEQLAEKASFPEPPENIRLLGAINRREKGPSNAVAINEPRKSDSEINQELQKEYESTLAQYENFKKRQITSIKEIRTKLDQLTLPPPPLAISEPSDFPIEKRGTTYGQSQKLGVAGADIEMENTKITMMLRRALAEAQEQSDKEGRRLLQRLVDLAEIGNKQRRDQIVMQSLAGSEPTVKPRTK